MPPSDAFPGDEQGAQPRSHLTSPQRKILDAVQFFLTRGEIPTVREVGALVGLRSPATVLKHLRALERRRWISLSGKSRGIRLARPVPSGAAQSPSSSRRLPLDPERPLDPEGPPAAKEPFAPKGLRAPEDGGIQVRTIRVWGAIAAGMPFESYSEGFLPSYDEPHLSGGGISLTSSAELPIDPRMFVDSGEVFALRVEGDSMIHAGILDGDYVIIRRQDTVEEGEIAAVIINGEGTLKRWRSRSADGTVRQISLEPANERFDPIEITEDDAKDVLVFGKYVGLVRGA